MQRKNYGRLKDVLNTPDLIDIQLTSYYDFLQIGIPVEDRTDMGMQEIFKEVFPIESFDQSCVLDFVSYEIGEPKAPMVDCIRTGKTFCVPLYATLRFENRTKQEVREERVFLGDMPLMTDRATFVINGAERVIISQLHRTPGICFETSKHTSGRILFSYRIIPDRGSWLEVQFDINDLIYIFLDRRRRRRKFLISTFLRALGHETNRQLLEVVYGVKKVKVRKLAKEDPDTLSQKFLAATVSTSEGFPIMDEQGNEVGIELGVLNDELLALLSQAGVSEIEVVDTAGVGAYFIKNIQQDPTSTRKSRLRKSTAACVPATRRVQTTQSSYSSVCSSTKSATTWEWLVGTRSTRSSSSAPTLTSAPWKKPTSSPPPST